MQKIENRKLMNKLIERPKIIEYVKAVNAHQDLGKVLNRLEIKELSADTVELINQEIEQLNIITDDDKNLTRKIKAKENSIVKLVESKHKIVPKNYYKKLWMVLGMSAFGIPIGVAFGLSIGNLGMLGIGLPIGMGIGVAVGTSMDNRAFKEGRQLDFEVK